MRIAVIGWGSLVPDPRGLNIDTTHGEVGWFPDGPSLPIEFARISRGNRLTLVINPGSREVTTYWAVMASDSISDAIANLREREGRPPEDRIGCYNFRDRSTSGIVSDSVKIAVESWGEERKLDAAIWTALEPNFRERTSQLLGKELNLSLEGIERFLKKLSLAEFRDVRNYITSAPRATTTELRGGIELLLRTVLPDHVVTHEAGHILIARALGWRINRVALNAIDTPFIIEFCKMVNGQLICGLIANSQERIAVTTNLERLLVTQGGRAADLFFNLNDEGQYVIDDSNARDILAELPNPRPAMSVIVARARTIVTANPDALRQIQSDIQVFLKEMDLTIFNRDYQTVVPNF